MVAVSTALRRIMTGEHTIRGAWILESTLKEGLVCTRQPRPEVFV